jgi:hypothetical protein
MSVSRKVLLAAALIVVGSRSLLAAGPGSAQCPGIHIDSSVVTAAEKRLICRAANEVQGFFKSYGIAQKARIRIHIASADIDPRLPHIGSYSAQRQTISILSQSQVQCLGDNSRLFGLPMDDTLYRSVVVHELAHAIADQNFGYEHPSLVAQEYVAYVAQLATLEPALREKILVANALPGYRDVDEMSCVYYAMDPSGFGIKAYRHFAALPHPGEFLRRWLSGGIRPADDEME